MPSNVPNPTLAAAAARRTGLEERELTGLLSRCEEIVSGEPVSEHDLLRLVKRIREIEAQLGF
jgi:hypothetical protein